MSIGMSLLGLCKSAISKIRTPPRELGQMEAQQQAGGVLNQPFSMASLKRRAFNQHLLDQIMVNLEAGAELTKFSPIYESLCNYGTISQEAA